VGFGACGGNTSCTLLSDDAGMASSFVTALNAGTATITAKLAPGSYTSPKSTQTTIFGSPSTLAIGLTPSLAWIAAGVTLDLPLIARVLSSGSPTSGQTVNYQLMKGSGTLSTPSAVTDVNGNATVTLHLAALSGDVLVSACVAPNNAPCQNLAITAVPAAAQQLQAVSGTAQNVTAGQTFQNVVVRVTDNASPAHPVAGASVVFRSAVERVPGNAPAVWFGDTAVRQPSTPVILSSSQIIVVSDGNGLANLQPSTGGFTGPVVIVGSALAGTASVPFQLQSFPVPASGSVQKTGGNLQRLRPTQ
jgi:hypothetical protein